MENLIKWVDISTERGNKNKLEDFDISVYRNEKLKASNAGNYVSFSDFFTNVYASNKKVRIGLIGDKIVIQFNNEIGCNIVINKSGKNSRLRISSVKLIDLIFEKNGYDKLKTSNIYSLKDMGDNTFLIEKKQSLNINF